MTCSSAWQQCPDLLHRVPTCCALSTSELKWVIATTWQNGRLHSEENKAFQVKHTKMMWCRHKHVRLDAMYVDFPFRVHRVKHSQSFLNTSTNLLLLLLNHNQARNLSRRYVARVYQLSHFCWKDCSIQLDRLWFVLELHATLESCKIMSFSFFQHFLHIYSAASSMSQHVQIEQRIFLEWSNMLDFILLVFLMLVTTRGFVLHVDSWSSSSCFCELHTWSFSGMVERSESLAWDE